jgi:hypothetical protein
MTGQAFCHEVGEKVFLCLGACPYPRLRRLKRGLVPERLPRQMSMFLRSFELSLMRCGGIACRPYSGFLMQRRFRLRKNMCGEMLCDLRL